ncbi:MAG: hypothetical protein HZB33_10220 [Nitrospirae bacterium]|nr:hypothetical protein [Nitrospirota bacterium]
MNSQGATLTELLVAMAIVVTLLGATGFSYQGWMGGYEIEKATKEIYTDFMSARLAAVQSGIQHIAVIDRFSYTIAEDRDKSGDLNAGDVTLPGFPKSLRYELHANNNGNAIKFDNRGMISNLRTLNFVETEFGPDYDCLRVSMSRIIMGRYKFNHNPSITDTCVTK